MIATLGARIVLTVLTRSQVRAELHRERLAPRLRALRQRYAERPEELQQRMMALYREEGTSPFAGVLPALAQSPVLLVVYGVFTEPLIDGEPNALLGESFAGAELGGTLLDDPSGWPVHVLLLDSPSCAPPPTSPAAPGPASAARSCGAGAPRR